MILDVKRVNERDSSGARVILQGHHRLLESGKRLLLGGADDRMEVAGMLRDTRSATVEADTDIVCHVLSRDSF